MCARLSAPQGWVPVPVYHWCRPNAGACPLAQ